LPTKDKVLLFLIVPLVLFSINFFVFDLFIKDKFKEKLNKIKNIKQTINLLHNKTNYTNIAKIDFIEKIAKKFNTNIVSIKIDEDIFTTVTTSAYQNNINLLLFLEQFILIDSFEISSNEKNTTMLLKFTIFKVVNKPKIPDIKNIINPFVKRRYGKTDTNNRYNNNKYYNLKLTAIIENMVKINNRWYKKGDDIDNFYIKDIFLKYVLLQKNGKIVKLRIYDEN
jgi:hypothetical protein